MTSGIIARPVFAFHMSMNPDNEESEVMFGDWNRDKMDPSYGGEPVWHPVVHKLFWSLQLDDVRIGDTSLGLCDDRDCMFTPDTGTSLLTFPTWAMTKFNNLDADYSKA